MNREELIKAQKELCQKVPMPMFAPEDGICWSCNRDIVSEIWAERAITGCPKCFKTYCD